MATITIKHYEAIYQLLLEISQGNFNYRIPRSHDKGKEEALIALLNLTVEEIQESFIHQRFISIGNNYSTIIQGAIILDDLGQIISNSPNISKILKYSSKELVGVDISTFLQHSSLKIWRKQLKKSKTKNAFEKNLNLTFTCKNGLSITSNCHLLKLLNSVDMGSKLILSFINITSNRDLVERKIKRQIDKQLKRSTKHTSEIKTSPPLKDSDLNKIREISEKIKKHPEQPIESLTSLAAEFNTNDFKLKQGFRELFGQTVFQYQMNERLNKAFVLVKDTQLSFKEIQVLTGFVSSSHFSKVFKKRYGHSPRELRKLEQYNY
ncbi:helix-turn-helix domain-containing protein [Aestuariibaculum sp. M13]|uniref:helix-turn-helix domain-containing protein n=1 Tax=Aestuariibaculum sp. M13 TaxID=2967132 RepID=UPI00215A0AB6|nr:helix-turn-helix domain-containing protein [Aestuariibaculum sp. M13]MCR8668235.1 helix-turn-helix domain-containing protein [Aestuariibaculum sp. M13]